MKPTRLYLLAELRRRGAAAAPVKASTTDLAKAVGAPQQTASRWLGELARERLIERRGKNVKLSRAARNELAKLALALEVAPKNVGDKKVLRGAVVRGLGEGAKFMRLPGYAKQLRTALGWTPFAGTLNVKLDAKSAAVKKQLEASPGVALKSFVERNQRFGSVKLFSCVVKARGVEAAGAVVLPEESVYGESVLEVVSPENLRCRLRLKDGAGVSVLLVSE